MDKWLLLNGKLKDNLRTESGKILGPLKIFGEEVPPLLLFTFHEHWNYKDKDIFKLQRYLKRIIDDEVYKLNNERESIDDQ